MEDKLILVPVTIDSIRVSLVSPHRIVVLKDEDERFLPIWIGPFEAEAINIALQGTQPGRPLTHDLFKSLIGEVGGKAERIVVADLREDTFYARIVMKVNGRDIELDARPSDAIAIAVRMQLPIFVADQVMATASIRASESEAPAEKESEESLDAFRDLLEDLDLDGLGKGENKPKED
ncbi:MAG: bifunctional nuclease family protein [Chloroflexi bacterium]|nr:bifunctional nuclease family protein [Chloroflexota bacterium]